MSFLGHVRGRCGISQRIAPHLKIVTSSYDGHVWNVTSGVPSIPYVGHVAHRRSPGSPWRSDSLKNTEISEKRSHASKQSCSFLNSHVHSFTHACMHAHNTHITRTQTQTQTPTPAQTNKQTQNKYTRARVVYASICVLVLLVTQTSVHECV